MFIYYFVYIVIPLHIFYVSILTCSFACILICLHAILFARNLPYMLRCLHIILLGLWWKQ